MKINLKKDRFLDIEKAYTVLKENHSSDVALKMIKDSLEDCFNVEFNIVMVPSTQPDSPFFVMSVLPEQSTIDKILSAVYNSGEDVIKKLWEQNKKWTIEIDEKIITDVNLNITPREFTAMILHEVGHIMCSNSVPTRVSYILKYELAKSSITSKMMLKDKIFKMVLSLPILNACVADSAKGKDSIKEEIKADKFAKSMGYTQDLYSILTKFQKSPKYPKSGNMNDNMKEMTKFSTDMMDQFKARQESLVKNSLINLRESCESPYIESVIEDIYNSLFYVSESSMMNAEDKLNVMYNYADKIVEDGYMTEFFIGRKELKRVDPNELDYIQVKIGSISSEDDKMLLITYIHSKLDLVQYYIDILSNPKLAKKYTIPHSMSQLLAMKDTLNKAREDVLRFKIPDRKKGLLVQYPDGYEG